VLEIVVRLEQRITSEELDKDAPDREHVTWIRPGKTCSSAICPDNEQLATYPR
jgi:hypothetical protein